MRFTAGLMLLASLPLAQAVAGTGRPISEIVRACRDSFPEVAANPNALGGWRLFDDSGGRLLCVYGSFPEDMLEGLLTELAPRMALTIAVRSTGGPAASWLGLAEHVSGAAVDLVVDEACFSSCANYLPVIARSIRAVENSLLVWHGGPSEGLDEDTELTMGSLFDIIAYDALSRRTRKLYAQAGVSIDLLRVSALPTDNEIMSKLMAGAAPTASTYTVAGYAFSPQTLAECFGLTGGEGMWHAGGDADLIRLAQRRSPGLVVLESPRTSDGARICAAVPTLPTQSDGSGSGAPPEEHADD